MALQHRRLCGVLHARSLAPVGRRHRGPDQVEKISAKEAATAALARLDAVNPLINAVVDHKPQEVLAEAAAIDAAIARSEEVGPLAGVPVTVKVNIDQVGFATTNGLKIQRDVIARPTAR